MKTLSILGCGDFLRWQSNDIKDSGLSVRYCFDPDQARAAKFAEQLGGQVASSADVIFADEATDAVALFVPPWVRRPLLEEATAAGKHLLLTKPLASTVSECDAILAAVDKAGVRAGVIYSRTGDAFVETVKDVLESGRFGRLALYRQDWLHAYPQWNNWATDPEKNGGPFMDAMIHNLNAANYLMGRPATGCHFFSDRLSHPDMACADTEQMVLRYEGGGMSHLFITWAADLATYGTEGNDREHIDLFYMVTDQGWRLTKESKDSKPHLKASREGKDEWIAVQAPEKNHYQAFAEAVRDNAPLPRVLVPLDDARADIERVRAKPL
ncbi:MAG: Gfo/Idh/MocA family protein [Verrucomicrobiota bacterium]